MHPYQNVSNKHLQLARLTQNYYAKRSETLTIHRGKLAAYSSNKFLVVILAGAILTGCASSDFRQDAEARFSTSVVQPQIPSESLGIPDHGDSVEIEAADPVGELTLSQTIALSMKRNPELEAFAWDLQGAQARIRQARLWPNPELEVERENFGGAGRFSGSDSAETTISLAQSLPLGGDIKRRRELAEFQSDLADWDYHAARLDTLVEVTQRFVRALAADRKLDLAKKELEIALTTESITSGRVEAGDASPVELARVVVPVVTAELELSQAERSQQAAYRRLSLSWGAKSVTFVRVNGDLDSLSPVPKLQELIRHINQNPAVARWTTEISVRIAEKRLAKAEAIPNLNGRFGVRRHHATDDNALVVGISLPLPFFDRGQGNIHAALMGEASARSRRRAAEHRIEGMLSDVYSELVTAQEEAVALRERALPAADKAYKATLFAFKEGKLPFFDVLDVQRTLFGLQERYLDALVVYHSMTAELESLIGRSLAEVSQ
jgi:cobalt-zinc-cadmium efflux system outer membrane protein